MRFWLIALLTTNDLQTGCKAAIFFGYGWWGGDASPPIPNGVSAPEAFHLLSYFTAFCHVTNESGRGLI